jgi:hypothetical protein
MDAPEWVPGERSHRQDDEARKERLRLYAERRARHEGLFDGSPALLTVPMLPLSKDTRKRLKREAHRASAKAVALSEKRRLTRKRMGLRRSA